MKKKADRYHKFMNEGAGTMAPWPLVILSQVCTADKLRGFHSEVMQVERLMLQTQPRDREHTASSGFLQWLGREVACKRRSPTQAKAMRGRDV